MSLDDRAADGEPHAQPAGLGGEEGIKDAGEILGGDSVTRVAYGNLNRTAMGRQCLDGEAPLPRLASGHGFHSIVGKVQDDLLKLDEIG